jgi:hypothetical protein
MNSTRSVRLLPPDDLGYRKHVAHHTYLAKVNSGSKTPDPRNVLTSLVERNVRALMATQIDSLPYRVLRWEQLDAQNIFRVRYRELDGVFQAAQGPLVILEVKASAGKSSIQSGIAQIRSTISTLKKSRPNTVGLLVIADLGKYYEEFALAAAEPIEDYFAGMDVKLLAWPPQIPQGDPEFKGLYISLVPEPTLCAWLPPEESELHSTAL